MPYIDWTKLPKAVRGHLEDRVRDRSITEDDMIRLTNWIRTNPEVPHAEWCKDFGTFTLAGEGGIPKTILMRGQPCKGKRIKASYIGPNERHGVDHARRFAPASAAPLGQRAPAGRRHHLGHDRREPVPAGIASSRTGYASPLGALRGGAAMDSRIGEREPVPDRVARDQSSIAGTQSRAGADCRARRARGAGVDREDGRCGALPLSGREHAGETAGTGCVARAAAADRARICGRLGSHPGGAALVSRPPPQRALPAATRYRRRGHKVYRGPQAAAGGTARYRAPAGGAGSGRGAAHFRSALRPGVQAVAGAVPHPGRAPLHTGIDGPGGSGARIRLLGFAGGPRLHHGERDQRPGLPQRSRQPGDFRFGIRPRPPLRSALAPPSHAALLGRHRYLRLPYPGSPAGAIPGRAIVADGPRDVARTCAALGSGEQPLRWRPSAPDLRRTGTVRRPPPQSPGRTRPPGAGAHTLRLAATGVGEPGGMLS